LSYPRLGCVGCSGGRGRRAADRWLWEDGGTYSRTTYANLFAAVTATLTGHIFIGSSSISGSFASLVGQGLEGGAGRGHPDFHDGREHHLDDDRHFPNTVAKIKTNEDSSSAYLILATPMAEPTG
jgi:hypothetical protein